MGAPIVHFEIVAKDAKALSASYRELFGGKRPFGADAAIEGLTLGQFADPEGHIVGVIQSGS
ncbi:MAG: hypothetical protein JWM93_114 [Frankiales bacterium]|nr:hypothetical protein [Frankiales bacterium]